MSTLTRANSNNRRPQYKDYVSFLESYKGGKKDDQRSVATSDSGVNFSLASSLNNSSSSVYSDLSDHHHDTKRHTVNLPPPKQQKNMVKTEMFIEIRNPEDSRVFEVTPGDSQLSVSSTAKIFENIGQENGTKQNASKKTSIGEISKIFEAPPASKLTLKKANSISEVSKVFQNGNSKPKNFNTTPKPFQTLQKPAITSPKPVFEPHHFPKSPSTVSSVSSLSTSPSPPQSLSPPPPAPVCLSPAPVVASPPPPPPPPLPPADFGSKSASNGIAKQNGGPPARMSANGATDGIDGRNGVNKNDPRVKKMVYGALRNMYGAYHDKANDYIATLPKNRVRKNNGLDSIIDSIASQGGLDKLTGRTNPNVEAD
ncbi:uncharacterized protein LOC132700209 [Cylas formicarius]|uniref:uncharacterized protein LOC132700209 n=1 Tax=Cylas formicarius TaxID=197179 RepID=UPI002958D1D7|nr:uncharacterized protein LOC132700209 [Cylas formicarius]